MIAILGSDADWVKEYYNINSRGFWELGNYILLRNKEDKEIAEKYGMSVDELSKKRVDVRKKLLDERAKRTRPGLDDKSLTSWNALMLKGYIDAYRTFGEDQFLKTALENGTFIVNHQLRKDGALHHNFKDGKSSINGYLEDYSFTIEAFIALLRSYIR